MKNRLGILLAVCSLGLAWAPTEAAESALGRLFHTPEERAALDAIRREPASAVPKEVSAQTHAPSTPSTSSAPRREGLIQRGGKPVAEWIDGTLLTAPRASARVPDP